MSIVDALVDHLARKFPHFQFELLPWRHFEGPDYQRAIKFYRPNDLHGRIDVKDDTVELWDRGLGLAKHRMFLIHKFSLSEPDSILWIERFVTAGLDRWKADLTQPLPAATKGCDIVKGDEALNSASPACHSESRFNVTP